jgi:hypothetical protein
MPTMSLVDIENAVRRSWSVETCDPADVSGWTPGNPAWGQCGATALVLNDLLGGELLTAEVHHADGSPQGHHNWNRLLGGVEVDLTREQFRAGEVIAAPRVIHRPNRRPGRAVEQYLALSERVGAELGREPPGSDAG